MVRWFGFGEETVAIAEDYLPLFLFAEYLEAFDECVHELLDVIGLAKYSTIFGCIQELVGLLGLLCVGLLSDDRTLQLVGVTQIAELALGLVVNIVIISCQGWFDPYLEGLLGRFAVLNRKATKSILKTGTTLAFGEIIADGEWEVLTIFASFMGPAEVAAWSLLGDLWDILDDITEAIADAAEVRTSHLLGAGQPARAKLSSYKSIYLAMFAAFLFTSLIFIGGEDIPTWLTKDPTLQRITAELIPLFGVANIALAIGTMSWTLVGCQNRYVLATAVGHIGTWFVTIPLGALFTYILEINLQGLTAAVVIGYMVSGTINSLLLFQTDWPEMSRRVIADNEESSSSLSSSSSSSSLSSSSSSSSSSSPGHEERDTSQSGTPTNLLTVTERDAHAAESRSLPDFPAEVHQSLQRKPSEDKTTEKNDRAQSSFSQSFSFNALDTTGEKAAESLADTLDRMRRSVVEILDPTSSSSRLPAATLPSACNAPFDERQPPYRLPNQSEDESGLF